MSVKTKEDQPGAGQGGAGNGDAGSQDDSKNPKPGSEGGNAGANAKKDENEGAGDDGELDVSKLDPKVKKLVEDLRKENAGYRTKNKSLAGEHGKLKQALIDAGFIENDDEAPEEKLKAVTAQAGAAAARAAILEAAVEHGVSKEQVKYFQFLVNQALEDLGEDEELDEEAIGKIALEAKKVGAKPAGGSTSVGSNNPKPGAADDMTVEKFAQMNLGERTELFTKNAELYERLKREAIQKNMFVR